jgi:hypothetical protein
MPTSPSRRQQEDADAAQRHTGDGNHTARIQALERRLDEFDEWRRRDEEWKRQIEEHLRRLGGA